MTMMAKGLSVLLGIVAVLTPHGNLSGQTPIWLEWQRVSDTNILADPSLGQADVEEKDFASADFDLDGDIDLIFSC